MSHSVERLNLPGLAAQPAHPRLTDVFGQALSDLGSTRGRARPGWARRYVRALIVSDLVLTLLAGVIAYRGRFGPQPDARTAMSYGLATLVFPVLLIGAFAAVRVYEPTVVSGSEELRRMANGAIRLAALLAVVAVAFKVDFARGYLGIVFPLALALCGIGRFVARRVLAVLRTHGACLNRVLVIGRERSVAEMIRTVRRDRTGSFEVVAACLETQHPREPNRIEDIPVLGSADDVLDAARRCHANAVAITAFSDLDHAAIRHLSWQLEGTDVAMLLAPRITDVAGPRIHVRPVAGLPLLHVEQPEFAGSRRVLKGLLDRTLSLLMLLLLTPVLLALATAVSMTSRGAPIFRQTRVGTRGQTFTLWKFRTMHLQAETEIESLVERNEHADGPLFKIRRDPRVTWIGGWLRAFSVDELPQLVQVLTGKMSLVGPRPPLPREVMSYDMTVHRRLLVKPGLTGLWQISGRSDLSWDDSVRLDLHYVENWSLALDLSILWKTAMAVLARRGAY